MNNDTERDRKILAATKLYENGERGQAIEALSECLELFGEDEKRSRSYGVLCSNLGASYAEIGNSKLALHFFLIALEIHREDGDDHDCALVSFNIGNAYKYSNNWAGVLRYYREALDLAKKCSDAALQNLCHLSLSHFLLDLNAIEEARSHLVELENLTESASPTTRWSRLMLLGRPELERDPGRALELAEQALELAQQTLNKVYLRESRFRLLVCLERVGRLEDAIQLAEMLGNPEELAQDQRGINQAMVLGQLYETCGDRVRALEILTFALRLIDERRVQLDGGERFKFMEHYVQCGLRVVSLLLMSGRAAEAFEASERVQARTTLDLMFRHQVKRQEGRRIGVGLNGRVYLLSPKIDEVFALLAEESTHLLKFFFCSNTELAGFFLSPGGQLNVWDCSAAIAPLKELLDCWPKSHYLDDAVVFDGDQQVARPAAGESERMPERPDWGDLRDRLQNVYELLFPAVIRKTFAEERGRLLIVPHQQLFALAFSAFETKEGRVLAEDWTLGTVPSAGVALQLDPRRDFRREIKTWESLKIELLGAVGAKAVMRPVFPKGTNTDENLRALLSFTELAGASAELDLLAATVGGQVRQGSRANRAAGLLAIDSADVVHFATHGLWDPIVPELSFLLMSDGVLTAHEIKDRFASADMVCLSGCQTGLGLGMPDSHFSLPQSLLIAGSRCILASLWPIPDEATTAFMEVFYTFLKQSLSPGEALQQTQRKFRETSMRWSYELLWSAFQLVGWPFEPLVGADSRPLREGPAFCGGDLMIQGKSENPLPLGGLGNLFLSLHVGVLIRDGEVHVFPKTSSGPLLPE